MNYYYDVELNFSKNNLMFYEWNKLDNIKHLKKVLICQVNCDTYLDLYNYNISLEKNIVDKFKNKTIVFACINGTIAIKFDSEGNSIERSFLSLDDELNIIDNIYTIDKIDLDYKKGSKIDENNTLRYDLNIKELIKNEINSLIANKEYKKLEYLYYEWFNKKLSNLEELKAIDKVLNEDIGVNEKKIYDLIKLSYSNV